MPISVDAGAGILTLSGTALHTTFPPAPRDTTLDQTLNLEDTPGVLTLSGTGDWLSRRWTAVSGALTLSGTGQWGDGFQASGATGTLRLSGLVPYIILQSAGVGETVGANFLRWSKFRTLDFTIDRSNMAGQAALPWKGTVYAILRRGEQAIVYGRNGVGVLLLNGQAFDMKPLLAYGLKSKLAVCDTGEAHYFVDMQNRLWKLGEGPELLDYREWLSTLGSTIAITFNPDTRLLYIGDGTNGFLYNVDSGSMGKGPATVTGIGLQGGTLYVVASGTMTIPNFAMTTDITDCGTRKAKSIQSLEIGVDTTLTLQAAIAYRHEKQSAFLTTNWYTIDSRGQVFIACMGYEFQFKVKATSAGFFHLDSLRVNGVVHAH